MMEGLNLEVSTQGRWQSGLKMGDDPRDLSVPSFQNRAGVVSPSERDNDAVVDAEGGNVMLPHQLQHRADHSLALQVHQVEPGQGLPGPILQDRQGLKDDRS